jgi:hypothetical protein
MSEPTEKELRDALANLYSLASDLLQYLDHLKSTDPDAIEHRNNWKQAVEQAAVALRLR